MCVTKVHDADCRCDCWAASDHARPRRDTRQHVPGERHGRGQARPHPLPHTSILCRCYRSCLPSLPGEEGRWSRLDCDLGIWCASSLPVTPREEGGGAMVATSSRVQLQCRASLDSPEREAPSVLPPLMRRLVQVPPENPLDLLSYQKPIHNPHPRPDKCNPSSRAQQDKARQHALPRPHVAPLPSLHLDRWALTDTTIAKTVAKRGQGLLVLGGEESDWSKRGGSTRTTGGAGMGGAAPARWREKHKKRENGKGFHPHPQAGATESFWGETKPRSGLGLVGANPDSPPAWQDANGTPVTLNCTSVLRAGSALPCTKRPRG